MKSVKDYDKDIEGLIAVRDSLEKTQTFLGGLAILVHDSFCRSNHTDQCAWMYEIKNGFHNWEQPTHKGYVAEAKVMISSCPILKLRVEKKGEFSW